MAQRHRVGSPDAEIARIIKLKARKLAQATEYRDDDPQDIEQDLHLKWLEIRSRHDASRGDIVTFADVSLNNHIRNMVAARKAQRRARRDCALLSPDVYAPPSDPETSGTGDDIGQEPDLTVVDRHIALRSVLRRLRPELREIAEALAQNTVADVARVRKLSRPTLYKRIQELRVLFREHGLDEYLP